MYSLAFHKRDNRKIVFGAWLGERFTDNSMQLYLEAAEYPDLEVLWVTKNEDVLSELKERHLPAAMWGSDEAAAFEKDAMYAVISNGISDVEHEYLGGAVFLDLWHGVPLKKIAFDNKLVHNWDSPAYKVKNFFKYLAMRKMYYFAPSENFREIYMSCFRQPEDHIIVLGQPRNDIFFDGSPCPYFKDIKFTGSRIILYCPTHRNEGRTPIEIHRLFDLPVLEKFLEDNDMYFFIKKHFYHRNESEDLKDYDRIIDITGGDYDVQKLIMGVDLLISDYSSIYIDYLLLNKPLLFYCYDLEDYLEHDREMYFEYDEVTPGAKPADFPTLLDELKKFAKEGDSYAEADRTRVRDFFYCKEGQGKVGPKIIEMIKNGDFLK